MLAFIFKLTLACLLLNTFYEGCQDFFKTSCCIVAVAIASFKPRVFVFWLLDPRPYNVFRRPGAHFGRRDQLLGHFAGRRSSNFVWKSFCFSILFFWRFGVDLRSQNRPTIDNKSFKNQLRKCTPTSKPLRSDFYRFFLRFSTPPPLGKQKI